MPAQRKVSISKIWKKLHAIFSFSNNFKTVKTSLTFLHWHTGCPNWWVPCNAWRKMWMPVKKHGTYSVRQCMIWFQNKTKNREGTVLISFCNNRKVITRQSSSWFITINTICNYKKKCSALYAVQTIDSLSFTPPPLPSHIHIHRHIHKHTHLHISIHCYTLPPHTHNALPITCHHPHPSAHYHTRTHIPKPSPTPDNFQTTLVFRRYSQTDQQIPTPSSALVPV